MRKSHMQVVIDGLKKRITDVERERDEVLAKLHRKADDHAAALTTLGAELGAAVKAHAGALAKHGEDLSGLAESVRASLLRQSEAQPEASAEPEAKAVTPITSKRGTKAAG